VSGGRIYVIDDDEAVRESLEALLDASGYEVATFGSAAAFREGFDPGGTGCILLDVRMPGMDGLTLLETLGADGQRVPVVMMTAHADVPMAARAMRAGAADFIEKPFAQATLLDSVAAAMARAGPPPDATLRARFERLTPRETEVLRQMVEGLPNKLIARRLGISEKTVKAHLTSVFRAIGVDDRTQAALWAVRNGVAEGPPRGS
jgi:two-component system response regulator FixJ